MTQAESATTNWARANRLAELAEVAPGTARNYISGLKKTDTDAWTTLCGLLDEEKDARNATIRGHVTAAKAHKSTANRRKSKGNPQREVRAGAPASRKKTGRPRSTCGKGEINADVLFDLRKVQKKHGVTCGQLAEGAKVLAILIDET
jgi:hypothetical protein